jgi:hypothetical protein
MVQKSCDEIRKTVLESVNGIELVPYPIINELY